MDLADFTKLCFTFGMYDLDNIGKMHHHYHRDGGNDGEQMGHWQFWNMWHSMKQQERLFGFDAYVWRALGEPREVQHPRLDGGGYNRFTGVWNMDFTDSFEEFEDQYTEVFGSADGLPDELEDWASPKKLWKHVSLQFDSNEKERKL